MVQLNLQQAPSFAEEATALWAALDNLVENDPQKYEEFIKGLRNFPVSTEEDNSLGIPNDLINRAANTEREAAISKECAFKPKPHFVFSCQLLVEGVDNISKKADQKADNRHLVQVVEKGPGKDSSGASESVTLIQKIGYYVNVCSSPCIKEQNKGGAKCPDNASGGFPFPISVGHRRNLPEKNATKQVQQVNRSTYATPGSKYNGDRKEKSCVQVRGFLDINEKCSLINPDRLVVVPDIKEEDCEATQSISISSKSESTVGYSVSRVVVDLVLNNSVLERANRDFQFKYLLCSYCLQQLLPLEQMLAQQSQQVEFLKRSRQDNNPNLQTGCLKLPHGGYLGKNNAESECSRRHELRFSHFSAVRVRLVPESFSLPKIIYKGSKEILDHIPQFDVLTENARSKGEKSFEEKRKQAAAKQKQESSANQPAGMKENDVDKKAVSIFMPSKKDVLSLKEDTNERALCGGKGISPLLTTRKENIGGGNSNLIKVLHSEDISADATTCVLAAPESGSTFDDNQECSSGTVHSQVDKTEEPRGNKSLLLVESSQSSLSVKDGFLIRESACIRTKTLSKTTAPAQEGFGSQGRMSENKRNSKLLTENGYNNNETVQTAKDCLRTLMLEYTNDRNEKSHSVEFSVSNEGNPIVRVHFKKAVNCNRLQVSSTIEEASHFIEVASAYIDGEEFLVKIPCAFDSSSAAAKYRPRTQTLTIKF